MEPEPKPPALEVSHLRAMGLVVWEMLALALALTLALTLTLTR